MAPEARIFLALLGICVCFGVCMALAFWWSRLQANLHSTKVEILRYQCAQEEGKKVLAAKRERKELPVANQDWH